MVEDSFGDIVVESGRASSNCGVQKMSNVVARILRGGASKNSRKSAAKQQGVNANRHGVDHRTVSNDRMLILLVEQVLFALLLA